MHLFYVSLYEILAFIVKTHTQLGKRRTFFMLLKMQSFLK